MPSRTELNARVGRVYYGILNNAAGSPNGLPVWEEMTAAEKYCHAVTGVLFLEALANEGLVGLKADIGIVGEYGTGDCAALLKYFEDTLPADRAIMDERLARLGIEPRSSDE